MEREREPVQHLTAAEVAQRLRVPKWSVYEMAKSGELPVLKIGRRVRFRETDLEEWEESKVRREP